jgi:carbon-monoxide dehydrogenase large subunit
MVTRHYTPRGYGFAFTNGIQASLVEVDTETGFVKLLKHWCVEDCGTVLNPMLVDEQVRGGIVQGLGAAFFEHCLYSPEGQLLNGNLADYLVPMAGEMPDIVVGHVSTPTRTSELGAKGAGEAGTAGAPGAVMNAVNDALAPFGVRVTAQPFTPERILKALGKV